MNRFYHSFSLYLYTTLTFFLPTSFFYSVCFFWLTFFAQSSFYSFIPVNSSLPSFSATPFKQSFHIVLNIFPLKNFSQFSFLLKQFQQFATLSNALIMKINLIGEVAIKQRWGMLPPSTLSSLSRSLHFAITFIYCISKSFSPVFFFLF